MKKKNSNALTNLISLVIFTLIILFLYGHTAGAVNAGNADLGNLISLTLAHIKASPLDVLNLHWITAAVFVCIYILGFVSILLNGSKIQADMKNIEHGSNDFQTAKETEDFLNKNTTEILNLDVNKLWHM